MQSITIRRPDDFHVHFRDEDALARTVPDCATHYNRAIAMPNLVPPVKDVQAAADYRTRILAHAPKGFEPLMTLYLTDNTTPQMIEAAHDSGIVYAAKLYPAGATTHSDAGVQRLNALYPALEAMQKCGMRLLIHGESTQKDIDIFEREKRFIEDTLRVVVQDFPALNIVLEHITTADAVNFVLAAKTPLAATITPHHLCLNRNDLLVGGIKPHHYCLPILKHAKHQAALIAAATSGAPQFFAGTDSAPHEVQQKESACGCAGIYNMTVSLAVYAQIFEAAGALDKLEDFTSTYGANFYGLPHNTGTCTLKKSDWIVPADYPYAGGTLKPLFAGQTLAWQVSDE